MEAMFEEIEAKKEFVEGDDKMADACRSELYKASHDNREYQETLQRRMAVLQARYDKWFIARLQREWAEER